MDEKIDLTKRLNKSADIVTKQNKEICNKINDTENDIKKHINDAEKCILEAIENIVIGSDGDTPVAIQVIDKENIDSLF
jgi:hypothetical protein